MGKILSLTYFYIGTIAKVIAIDRVSRQIWGTVDTRKYGGCVCRGMCKDEQFNVFKVK